MNILISVSNFAIGGAQNFILRLATALSVNHSVYVYGLYQDSKDTIIKNFPSSVKVLHFPLPAFIDIFLWKLDKLLLKRGLHLTVSQFWRKLYFRHIIKLFKIDIINSHLYDSDNFVTNIFHQLQVPIVITDHGDYCYIVEKQYAALEEVLKIFIKVDGIVYLSDYNANSLSKYIACSKAIKRKIYNCVSLVVQNSYSLEGRYKLGILEDALVFGMVARGIPEKGWAEAIQAFISAQALTTKDMHIILVGDSEYLQILKKTINDRFSNKIHFVGYTSNPNYWLECFDVGILPTYFAGESLPNSISEYLSFGKPVIATKVGAIPEMLSYEDKIIGFVINLNQDKRPDTIAMTKAMLTYADNATLLKKHSYLAKQASDKFKTETCIKSYESLFIEILGNNIKLN